MIIEINEQTADEIIKEFHEFMDYICGDTVKYDYKDKKDQKKSEKLNYEAPRCTVKKTDQTASVSNDSYVKEQLIKKINDLEKENASLKQKNNDIFKYGKVISDTGHKIVEDNERLNNQIKRMLYTDGNKIVSDIKILIETARGCGMIGDPNFVDAMKMIAKVANDFVDSKTMLCQK